MKTYLINRGKTTKEGRYRMSDEEQANKQSVRYGLLLRVYRRADDDGIDDTNGGVSGCHEHLTLVGFVNASAKSNPPVFEWLPPEYQCDPCSSKAPPAFLAKRSFGEGSYYLVPGDEKTGEPLPGSWMEGGNFAGGVDTDFAIVVSTTYLIPISDRLVPEKLTRKPDTDL